MTRAEYLRTLDAVEAGIGLNAILEDGAPVRVLHYNVILQGLSALRDSIAIGAKPWEAVS